MAPTLPVLASVLNPIQVVERSNNSSTLCVYNLLLASMELHHLKAIIDLCVHFKRASKMLWLSMLAEVDIIISSRAQLDKYS